MAERRFLLSKAARQDLLGIGRFTERVWGRAQRNHYLGQLDEAFSLIGDNPQVGQSCDDIADGYRRYPQGSHVVYYRIGKGVEIIRVLHERMDPDASF